MPPSCDTPLFGPRRNPLLSKWNSLFDTNPKEWISFKPALGLHVYPCYSCRHMFSSHKSFKDHINRRAVVLTYNCPSCEHNYKFFNRCALLLHARKHFTLQQGEINLSNIEVDILPVELAGLERNPDIQQLFDDEENLVDASIYINAQFYAPRIEDKGQEIIILMPNDLVINKAGEENPLALKQLCRNLPFCRFVTLEEQKKLRQQNILLEVKQEPREDVLTLPVISKIESLQETMTMRCSECNMNIDKIVTLQEHFLDDNRPRQEILKCTTCKYVAPTSCSLRAHERLHSRTAPYICPECGEEFSDNIILRRHIEDECFHLAKFVRYRCPGRKCGKLFAVPQNFGSHFSVHIREFYKCKICGQLLDSLNVTFEHLNSAHKNNLTGFNESYKKCFDCTVCNIKFSSSDLCQKHIYNHSVDREKCMYVYLCKFCKSYFRSTHTYMQHISKCSKNFGHCVKYNRKEQFIVSKYISGECSICKNKIIFTKDREVKICARCRNVPDNKSDRCYCILCKTQISLSERKRHQILCRFGRPKVVVDKLNLDSYLTDSNSDLDSSPSKKRNTNEKNRQRRQFRIKKSSEIEFDLTADEPIHFDGTYQCRLCNFKETDRKMFHNHIKLHRDSLTCFQCMECAECFVVKPSLIKHLLHFHNISNHEEYFRENECFNESAVKELAEVVKLAPYVAKEHVKENQCKVCLEEFENKDVLDKHFRKHGMAFLARNSL